MTTTTRFRDAREVKAWNDAMVVKYDLDRFHDHPSPLVRFVESRRVEVIFRLLDARPHDRVLEVGCGAGHLLARLPPGAPSASTSPSRCWRGHARASGRAPRWRKGTPSRYPSPAAPSRASTAPRSSSTWWILERRWPRSRAC